MATATKSAPTDGPTTTLTVPAKPALTTAANLATLAGSAMVVAGPPGWIAGAAVAAGGAAVGVSRSLRRRRANRQATIAVPSISVPKAGRNGGPLLGRSRSSGATGAGGSRRASSLLGGGRSSSPGRAAGGRRVAGTSAAGTSTGRSGGTHGGLLGRSSRAGGQGGRGRLFGGNRSSAGGGGRPASNRTPTSRTPTSRGRLGRAAAAARRTAGAIRAGARAATPRAAAAEVRRHANRPTPTGRGPRRRMLGAAGVAAGLVGLRNGYRTLRRFTRRRILGQPDPQLEPKKTEAAKPQPEPRRTGDRVRRPQTTTSGTDSTTSTEGDETMAGNGTNNTPQPVGPVYQAARRVHATAAEYTVKGVMELRTEAWEFPHTIAALAAAIRARVEHCTKEAVDPAYAQALAHIASTVDAAAQAAANLGPSFDALHKREIDRILRPRPNEQKWDTTANR